MGSAGTDGTESTFALAWLPTPRCCLASAMVLSAWSRGINGRWVLEVIPKLPRRPSGEGGAGEHGVATGSITLRGSRSEAALALIAARVAWKLNFSRFPVEVLLVEVAVVLVSMLLAGLVGQTGRITPDTPDTAGTAGLSGVGERSGATATGPAVTVSDRAAARASAVGLARAVGGVALPGERGRGLLRLRLRLRLWV